MKKLISGLLCAAMTASLFTVMSGGASAAGTTVDSSWQYKTMVDLEELQPGYSFTAGGETDQYSLYCSRGDGWQAKVGTGGYKGSNTFEIFGKGDKTATYAQPLINAGGFDQYKDKLDFEGATEFWMWVDFTHIQWDEVGLQFRIIENDYKPDGTVATPDLSQISPAKGKPIYIQSSPTAWKSINVTTEYVIPVDQMQGYKGFIRIPLSSLEMNDAGTDDDNGKIDLKTVSQLWFIFNYPNKNPSDYVAFDQCMFVGPIKDGGKPISNIKLTDTNQGGGSNNTTATTKAPASGGSATTAPAGTTVASSANTTAADSSELDLTDVTNDSTTMAALTSKATTTTAAKDVNTQPKKSSPVVPIVIAVVCVVLVGGGAAVYFFVIRKKKKPTDLGDTK